MKTVIHKGTAAETVVDEEKGGDDGDAKDEKDGADASDDDGDEGRTNKGGSRKADEDDDEDGDEGESDGDDDGDGDDSGEGGEDDGRSDEGPITRGEIKELLSEVQAGKKDPVDPEKDLYLREFDDKDTEGLEKHGFTPAQANMVGKLINAATKGVYSHFAGELGSIKKEAAISHLSREKGFEDIGRYRPGIDTFLKDVSPSHHSNPKILKTAFWVAKGKNSGGSEGRARKNREANTRLSRRARGHEGAGVRKGGPGPKSTAIQKDARKQFGMGEKEYRSWGSKR